MPFRLRPATPPDADAIARVFSPSVRLLTFLPPLHTIEDDRWFIRNRILLECRVTVAEDDAAIRAFLARDGEEIRLLHTHPDHIGKGAGGLLITAAKATAHSLRLWCFQANAGARRFYERHGFQAVAFTDGERNEEKLPDVLYRWSRP
jgi:GNAT superfamily N-acetyltransferase